MDPLTEVEQPLAHLLRATNQSVWVRLYGTPALHRVLPTPLALRLAALRGWAEWRFLRRRRDGAQRDLEALLPGPVDSATVRRRIVDDAVRAELQWRPWLNEKLPIEGLEHLDRARAESRGVILATAHLGPFLALIHALAAQGRKLYVSGGHRLGEPGLDGRVGRWVVAQNRWVEDAGCRWVRKPGSYAKLRALLQRGEVVWMGADAKGSVETTLAGHRLHVAGGVGRLAAETGARIVPAFVLRRGYGQVGVILPPLPPSEEPQELTDRVCAVIGEMALAHPEQVHELLLKRLRSEQSGV